MTLMDELTVEARIPFKQITNLCFQWRFDEHAALTLDGIMNGDSEEDIFKDYKGTLIKVDYEGEILFHGIIRKTEINITGGVYRVRIEAASASCQLDAKMHNEMFQDVNITYKQMLRQLITKRSGQIISAIGDEPIRKPLLCYQETEWQFARRMASHFNSHIIADIKTGKPALWFGLRKGKKIEKHELICEQIEYRKSTGTLQRDRLTYLLKGRNHYQLGDQLLVEDVWQTVYEKEASLERGELLFSYRVAREETLGVKTYYQENITGLSLKGTVERTEKEQIYISLDVDGKSGEYPFPWYPESGNVLYAMPEKESKAEVYFMGPDEREAIAIRCRDTGNTAAGNKMIQLPDNAKVSIDRSKVRLEKSDQITLSDNEILLKGSKNVNISAAGKVKIKARTIQINSAAEITWVTNS